MSNDMLSKIEDLIVGAGSDNFRNLERLVDVFCPFEAIGMVDQEIRHAKYLAYIMDPHRPHGFGSVFLREFLMILAELPDSKLSKLNTHLMDLSNARISLEWKRIDILIEIPTGDNGGIVIAVELKINAAESDDQLERYQGVLNGYYKGPKWVKEFIFLTKNEDESKTDGWADIGMAQIIADFESVFAANHFAGESADLFLAYANMMRRRHLGNTETEVIARELWAKHYEALNLLMQYRPDRMDEIFVALKQGGGKKGSEAGLSQLAEEWSTKEKFTIKADECDPQIFRFYVEEWKQYDGMLSSTSGVLREKNILILEIREWGGQIRVFFLLTAGDEDIRNRIFNAVRLDPRIKLPRSSVPRAGNAKILSAEFALNAKDFEALVSDGVGDDTLQKIRTNAKVFFDKYIPIYDEVLQHALDVNPA